MEYWNTLDSQLESRTDPNLKDLSTILHESAIRYMNQSTSFRRPEKSPELITLIRQRRLERNRDQRRVLSRQIQRVARRELPS